MSHFGGDPVAQIIANVYQMNNHYSILEQQNHCPYQPKQSPGYVRILLPVPCALMLLAVLCGIVNGILPGNEKGY